MYLELALRRGAPLATFDQKLAQTVRAAGGQVFGDRP
jgi:predicted nucleic acid-binding protein